MKEYQEKNKEKLGEKYKQYRDNNKDYFNEYNKRNYEEKKEQISEKNKVKINCVCGCEITKINLKRHQSSKNHLNLINKI